MKIVITFLLVLTASLFVACSGGKNKEAAGAVSEQQVSVDSNKAATSVTTLPSFQMMTEEGNIIKLTDLKGKKVFVNLWASWCPPCRAELPSIQKLYQSVDTSKTVFVLLSLDDNFEKAKHFKNSSRLKMPVYYPAEQLPGLFNVDGIPATFIFNEQGDLVQRVDGRADYDSDEFRNLLQK